jgi:hypothetical protein
MDGNPRASTPFSFSKMSESVHFYAPLEYTAGGSRHTVVCEGTWTSVGTETRLRVDCEFFLAFWLSGVLADDVLKLDGGRFDDTWTDGGASVHFSEFTCSADEICFRVRYGQVELVIPRPGSHAMLGFGADSQTVTFPSSSCDRGLYVTAAMIPPVDFFSPKCFKVNVQIPFERHM